MESVGRIWRWQGSLLDEIAGGGYALARFARPRPGGHTWQQWAFRLLVSNHARRVQGPGSCHLFHLTSASGLRHELDAAGISEVALVIEAKDQRSPLNKSQIDEFDGKTRDYLAGGLSQGWRSPLYRMIWSVGTIDSRLRPYAAIKGIILVSPDRVPLPCLLGAVERWDAPDWFPDAFLSELVLLAERACRPLNASAHGGTNHSVWRKEDFADLEYLHEMASEKWLVWLDQTDSLHFERKSERTLRLIAGVTEVAARLGFQTVTSSAAGYATHQAPTKVGLGLP